MKLMYKYKYFLLSLFFISFTFFGLFINYSPVPHNDSWKTVRDLLMVTNNMEGLFGPWLWDQHNEHRILLTRLIFFLDYELFGGRGVLNIVSIFATLAFSALVFTLIAEGLLSKGKTRLSVTMKSCRLFLVFLHSMHGLFMEAKAKFNLGSFNRALF